MTLEDNLWDIPYNKAFFKTSHNSYEHSIREQLNKGVRGLEYDIHDDKIQELGDFEVYHLQNHIDCLLNVDGNPNDLLLSNWLKVLDNWSSEQNKDHAPITLFVELKDSIIDSNNEPEELFGIKKLNKIIIDSFKPKTLFTFKDFRENNFKWPTVREMKGKVLIVLVSYWGGYWAASEGGFESRLKYLENSLEGKDDICFVSWVQEDQGAKMPFLKKKTYFWKCSLEHSTKHFSKNVKAQRLTRADFDKIVWGMHIKTYFNKNYEKGYRINFPATDLWGTDQYDSCFPWSI
ncbi:MAG: Ca2+-dependent phosphoinositide-specific phospholipase C [Promethearchaeota archaeon]